MRSASNTPSFAEALERMISAQQAGVQTMLPGRVESYDASTQKAVVQPLLKKGYLGEEGDRVVDSLPAVSEVPVAFYSAGGYRITFPVQAGDYGMLHFASGSLDGWLAKGGEVDPGDDRRNHLTDAVFYPGLRPFNDPLESAPTTCMSIGNDSGPVIEIDGTEIRIGGVASVPTILGPAFVAALTTYLTVASTAWAALAAFPILVTLATPLGAAGTGATTLAAALASHLTTIAKVK